MSMFYGASKENRERAKKLRRNSTKAEDLLWEVLKDLNFVMNKIKEHIKT
jgi:very-short-patch-repair endonuclease